MGLATRGNDEKYMMIAALLLGSVGAQANVVVNGTRVIYPANNKDVIVQLLNNGADPHWFRPGSTTAISIPPRKPLTCRFCCRRRW